MNVRYLILLTTLVFLGFSVSAFAGKYGPPYPTFDVAFVGELQGHGYFWQSSKKQKSLTYWASDHLEGSEGKINSNILFSMVTITQLNELRKHLLSRCHGVLPASPGCP